MEETATVPDECGGRDGASFRGYCVVRGTVVRGDGRGRRIGYPTANVAVPAAQDLPADGVYAGAYERPDGSRYPALISVGRRPTFYECGRRVLEVHLLDCQDVLYGECAAVAFVSWLRDQQRFDSATGLVMQIGRDVDAVRCALAADGWTESNLRADRLDQPGLASPSSGD